MALVAPFALLLIAAAPQADRFARRPAQPDLDAAIQIDRWLEETAVKTPDGWAWPAVPDEFAGKDVPKEKLDRSLYSGSAGIVLFGMQLAFATQTNRGTDSPPLRESPFIELPTQAAHELLATLPAKVEGEGCGLYTGVAGIGFALHHFSQATGWVDGHRGARRCVELLEKSARVAGAGIEWSDTTDVISGGAGIGLFLIYMAERDRDPLARDLAIRAGRRLLELGERESIGRSWRMDPKFPRVMPNFSHGTAGVAFFLARLYELTGDVAFLDGALDGAHHLLSIADTANDGCRIHHDAPDGRDLYYLGWCHGPIGTAQLFMKLAQVTGDADWSDWTLRCANSVRSSGIPEATTPGFWNNVGMCCGSAGVASFFQSLARAHQPHEIPLVSIPFDDPDQTFARRCLDSILAHGTQDEHGLRFVQAEHRTKPELLQAQVGLMQGAAGVGLALLQFESIPRVQLLELPDGAGAPDSLSIFRDSLFPTRPAAEPDAATNAFENLGRAVLFVAPGRALPPTEFVSRLREHPPQSLAASAWFDAASAVGAKLVLLEARDRSDFCLWNSAARDATITKLVPGVDLVADFVRVARADGLAVGLSLASIPGARELRELLTGYGPLTLLRIEVASDFEEPEVALHETYVTAKALQPHCLVEFVTTDTSQGGGRGENGVQRVGELWPSDVVADFDHGPTLMSGVAGAWLRPIPSPEPDRPWRIVGARRFYVPLQVEVPIGPKIHVDAARARNVLIVVPFEADGRLTRDVESQLRELGR